MSALEVPWDVSWPARTSTHRPHLSDERNHDRSRDETILDVDCTDNPHAAERRDDFGLDKADQWAEPPHGCDSAGGAVSP